MGRQESERQSFIVNAAYFAVMGLLVILVLRFLVPWLMPFIIGYLIAVISRPGVRFLSERGVSPKLSGFVVVLLAYAVIGVLLGLGGTRLVRLMGEVFAGLPDFYEYTLEPAIRSFFGYISESFGTLAGGLADYEALTLTLEDFQSALISLSTTALNFIGTLGSSLPGFFLSFFFTIMSSLIISANYNQVTRFIARQIPERYHDIVLKIRTSALRSLVGYIVANLKIMCVTFVELLVGLLVLGVQNAPLVALGIAVFDFFPVLGVGGILIPWAALELLRGEIGMAAGLIVLYLVVAFIRWFIEPRIVSGQLGLHPLLTLSAIYLGFQVMGIAGMILFPITAQILVSLHHSGAIKLWRE